MSQNPSNPIPLNTVLGERYKVTSTAVMTADGDAILDGKDQVLNRRVSIVVSAAKNNDRLIANARTMATNSRSNIQILDLGNTNGKTYLITSYSRPDSLLDNFLADTAALAASSESEEALGEEIFGDEAASNAQSPYISPAGQEEKPALSSEQTTISATRSLEAEEEHYIEPRSIAEAQTVAVPIANGYAYENYSPYEEYNDYSGYSDYPEEPDFADEEDQRRGGVWIVAVAAIILLVIGVAAVFANLNGMVDQEASNRAVNSQSSQEPSSGASSSQGQAQESSASPSTSAAEPKFVAATRIVPSNPSFMADQDATLGQMFDNNPSSAWMSYGFASANFGSIIQNFSLALELEQETPVSSLTIQQISGSGGAFTVYTNNSASLDGATQVGSGSFTGPTVEIQLDKQAQGQGNKYLLIQFTEAPAMSQPIAGYRYGVRIAEITANS